MAHTGRRTRLTRNVGGSQSVYLSRSCRSAIIVSVSVSLSCSFSVSRGLAYFLAIPLSQPGLFDPSSSDRVVHLVNPLSSFFSSSVALPRPLLFSFSPVAPSTHERSVVSPSSLFSILHYISHSLVYSGSRNERVFSFSSNVLTFVPRVPFSPNAHTNLHSCI